MSQDIYPTVATIRLFRDGALWCALIGSDPQGASAGSAPRFPKALRDLAKRLEAEGWRPEEPHRGLRVVPKPEK